MNFEADIPPDMAEEIARYIGVMRARQTDDSLEVPAVLLRLLRLGLNQAWTETITPPARRIPPLPLSTKKTPSPMRAVSMPVGSDNSLVVSGSNAEKVVTHAWAAGLILPCGIFKKGTRHAATLDQVTCRVCRDKVSKR